MSVNVFPSMVELMFPNKKMPLVLLSKVQTVKAELLPGEIVPTLIVLVAPSPTAPMPNPHHWRKSSDLCHTIIQAALNQNKFFISTHGCKCAIFNDREAQV